MTILFSILLCHTIANNPTGRSGIWTLTALLTLSLTLDFSI